MISSAFETYQKNIQLFLSAGSDYERNKASIETQFQREKETTESDLKKTTTVARDTLNSATATTENNLKNAIAAAEREQSNAKNEASKVIAPVRNSMKAAQNIINQNKWNKKIQGGISDHVITASTSIA